jgi:hypothetical protein
VTSKHSLRAVHRGLAAAYRVLGRDDLAAQASRRSGLGSLPADSQLLFGGFWVNAEDGFLARNHLPELLRDHPAAVVPYLVTRENFTARLYHQRTGYWQPDGHGLEPLTAGQRAAALDLLAGGSEERFVAAATTLIGNGDDAVALDIIAPGLLRHPASAALAGLRQTALHRLLERYQQSDPFKFLIYAELAGAELGPVQ